MTAARTRDEDRGSTLILVLVLVVIAGLVVVPLMTYTTSVLRLNTAVSARTKDVEASKAGLRLALADPTRAFTECAGDGTLGTVTVNDELVTTTCTELGNSGPLDALGYQVPIGAVALQLGAAVPSIAAGGSLQSDPVPPYPDDSLCSGSSSSGCWWASHLPLSPNEPWDAVDSTIWMPELPQWPSEARTSTPYNMPADRYTTLSGAPCKVFFPGRYGQPLDLNGDVYYYFASGVYYFEQPITVSQNANVVVGYGLEDFESYPDADRSFCADDLEVATNVESGPTTLAIDGGGATWLFGSDARLIVDDAAGSPRIRFNQRYAEEDQGGRVSIMTVNGVFDGTPGARPHDVPLVNHVPASRKLETYDTVNDLSNATAIDATAYVPSCGGYPAGCALTDAARAPQAVSGLAAAGREYFDGTTMRGSLRISWAEPTGNDVGGALLNDSDGYVVEIDGTRVCDQPGDIVHDAGTLSCYATGLAQSISYTVAVRAVNPHGAGPSAVVAGQPGNSGTPDQAPGAVTGVTVEETDQPGAARVGWTPPASSDAPVTGYRATIEEITPVQQPQVGPVIGEDSPGVGGYAEVIGSGSVTTHIPATDANNDPLTVTEFLLDPVTHAGWTAEVNGLDVTLTPPARDPVGEEWLYIPYTVSDGVAETPDATGTELAVRWAASAASPDPHAFDFEVRPNLNDVQTYQVAAYDPYGGPLTVETSSAPAPGWTVSPGGTPGTITIGTSIADGSTYTIGYKVVNSFGAEATATITVHAPTTAATFAGDCTVVASPWFDTDRSCVVSGLTPVTDPATTYFEVRVEATSATGTSVSTPFDPAPGPHPTEFAGTGTAAPAPPVRVVEPWVPEPVIDIRAGGPNATHVMIAGYVAVPMGRIRVDNPAGNTDDIVKLMGGVSAGTFDVNVDDTDSIVGFFNDLVLQRTIRITSTAGTSTSTAIVQVNEDGAYAVNSWVTG